MEKVKYYKILRFGIGAAITLSFLLNSCTPSVVDTSTTISATSPTTKVATMPEQTSTTSTIVSKLITSTPTITAPSATSTTITTTVNPDSTVKGGLVLPEPAISEQSVELCLNSRYSIKTELTGSVTTQQLSNILWAAGKAPLLGPSRTILVATQKDIFGTGTGGTYSYDPKTHSLTKISDKLTDQGAFKISWNIGRDGFVFDAGLLYMPSLLTAVSSWGDASQISACPKQLGLVFGSMNDALFNSQCVAISSVGQDELGYLPNPSTNGNDSLRDVLSNLTYISTFDQTNLTLSQISQLLWAGYGCTPHLDKKGITTPSAMDQLYLTGTIYLVSEKGVFRYQNRKPNDNFFTKPDTPSWNYFNTQDHRLEQIIPGDVRTNLQSAISNLPQAPCYVILSLDDLRLQKIKASYDTLTLEQIKTYAQLETGFVSFNYLLQASAIGLGCNFRTQLTSTQQDSIQNITGIPSSHKPEVVVSLGGKIQ